MTVEAPTLPDPDAPPVLARLQAVLLVAEEPVEADVLAELVEADRVEVDQALHQWSAALADAGIALQQVGGAWRLTTAPSCSGWVRRYLQEGPPARLSQAALETLAIVAYRQPVTRAAIAAIRGVASEAVLRTLQQRGLVCELGTEVSGAIQYGTTPDFLDQVGLASLEDLPSLAPLLPGAEALPDEQG